ncbi:MAG TPA: methyltransferase [Acidobacteriota bacterium]|nr:methyltransferase [Acidobacteriota bacterium]
MEIGSSPETILKLAQGFMECRIFQTAAELNLFTILDQTPLSAAEVADRISGDARALAVLLDALVAMGLLVKIGQTYECKGDVAGMLSAHAPQSILPMVLHMASLWKRWSRLTDIVKGRGASDDEFDFTRDADELKSFIGAMHSIGAPMAKRIVKAANPGASRALLDVGGGSGTYTIAFLRAVPGMRATLFDLPDVIEMARERLKNEGLLDRVTLVPGSFYLQEFPDSHDLALISAIIHSNSIEENLELYRKVFRALRPGGRILIRDYVMSPDRTWPRDGTVFAINMLVGTTGGGTYTYDEIETGLRQAGFEKIRLLKQGENMDAIVEAFKP